MKAQEGRGRRAPRRPLEMTLISVRQPRGGRKPRSPSPPTALGRKELLRRLQKVDLALLEVAVVSKKVGRAAAKAPPKQAPPIRKANKESAKETPLPKKSKAKVPKEPKESKERKPSPTKESQRKVSPVKQPEASKRPQAEALKRPHSETPKRPQHEALKRPQPEAAKRPPKDKSPVKEKKVPRVKHEKKLVKEQKKEPAQKPAKEKKKPQPKEPQPKEPLKEQKEVAKKRPKVETQAKPRTPKKQTKSPSQVSVSKKELLEEEKPAKKIPAKAELIKEKDAPVPKVDVKKKEKVEEKKEEKKEEEKKERKEEKKKEDKKDEKKEEKKEAEQKPKPKKVIRRRAGHMTERERRSILATPRRHREASLNALAKVHCLYENETRSALLEAVEERPVPVVPPKPPVEPPKPKPADPPAEVRPARNLRTAPGLRSVGRHWDVGGASSTSSSSSSSEEEPERRPERKRRRRRAEPVAMDLRDMVVRKRMASLNASAIMAATAERRVRSGNSRPSSSSSGEVDVEETDDDEVISAKKVAVILNQDTDLSITAVHINSTTRSTRHEGFCSISGMQYRISSTSHTQTETAVSTETTTLIHTEHVSIPDFTSSSPQESGSDAGSSKAYTPLGALSSMQPPGSPRYPPSPASSAFSAPCHPHHAPPPPPPDIHGYYQPAGPLISAGSSTTKEEPEAGGSGYAYGLAPPAPPPPPPAAADYARAAAVAAFHRRPYHHPYYEPAPYAIYPPPHYYPYPQPPPPCPFRQLHYLEGPAMAGGYGGCGCAVALPCPKNVHTGPLTGRTSEGSESPASGGLRPVALALPSEPAPARAPPSPARGSVGVPWAAPAAALTPAAAAKRRLSGEAEEEDDVGGKRSRSEEKTSPGLPETASTAADPPCLPPAPPRSPPPATLTKGGLARKIRARERQSKESVESCGGTVTVSDTPIPRTLQLKWSNGWRWSGQPYTATVFIRDDQVESRTCYPCMVHKEGDVIQPRDCVLLKSGSRKNLPFVAKVAALWENPEDGEMMVSLLWYYRPEHTEQGRQPYQSRDEIFASRHRDSNSVATIEDKCYVLTFNEYCRYMKSARRTEVGYTSKSPVPETEGGYPRSGRLPPGRVAPDLVFFCTKVYDFRLNRILKNPTVWN